MFENPSNWLVAGGLALGVVFGLIVYLFRFCLVNAVSNVSLIKDYRYALAFCAAILVAITGTQLLELMQIVEIDKVSYRDARFDWLGVVAGGLVFGVGATLAGGDAARVVVLAGQGSKAGWVALFFFLLFATITQLGVIAIPREYSLMHNSINLTGGDAGIAALFAVPGWLVLAVVDIALVLFIILKWKHADVKLLVAGAVLGTTVVAAWYVTGVLAFDDFNPRPASALTVSGPMWKFGNTLIVSTKHSLDFQMSFVLGLLAIAFVLAVLSRSFRLSPLQGSAGRIALGGALMGIGGTFAYGCNVGQGFSGLSTLSLESVLAVIAMLAGIHFGTRWLEKTDR